MSAIAIFALGIALLAGGVGFEVEKAENSCKVETAITEYVEGEKVAVYEMD